MIKKFYHQYMKIPVAARAGIWFVICTLLQKCIAFITVPIFTRLMPTEEYGMYSVYLSWYNILTVFCTLNMHHVIYVNNYTKADSEKEKKAAAVPLLSLSFIVTIVIFIIYLLFHSFFNRFIGLPTPLVCLLFAQILFEPPVNFWTMEKRFNYKYRALVIRTLTMVVLNAVLGILFVWMATKDEAIARALSIVLVQIIFGGIFYIYFCKQGKTFFSTKGWKHALNVQLPLIPHSLSLTVLSSSDRIMIKNMVGAAEAGIYSVAYSAGYVVNVLKVSIVDALRPWIYQNLKEKKYQDIRKVVNVLLFFVLGISTVFTIFAPEIIYIMAPKQYHDAVYVVPPVAASSYFTFLYNIFSIIGMYYEKTKKIMVASITGAVLNLGLNAVCIPLFGYIAAAYTTLVCYIFFSFAHYYIMQKISKSVLNDTKIYDMRIIVLLSIVIVLVTIGLTFTYEYPLIRYSILLLVLLIAFIKRKTLISTLKQIKKKNKSKTQTQQD